MSYRIYVNHYQCLGNHECPEVLIKELERQGCKMDEDDCFHDFEIKELQPIIKALEEYIFQIHDSRENGIGNFNSDIDKWRKNGNYTQEIFDSIECGYMFITYNFLNAIEGKYEKEVDYSKNRIIYKIKEGQHIYMSGF